MNRLAPGILLAGFANPALLAVVALMVMGQGLVQTGVMERSAGFLLDLTRGNAFAALALAFGCVLVVSGVLNNTPVVVISSFRSCRHCPSVCIIRPAT